MATVISKEDFDALQDSVISRAWAGEEIVVEQRGGPKLRLVAVDRSPSVPGQRVLGGYEGIKEAPGVWDPMTDEE